MSSSFPDFQSTESLYAELSELIEKLPNYKYGKFLERSLRALARIAKEEIERLDWKILSACLEDMERAFRIFYPYRHIRKITVFGSARICPNTPEYNLAVEFARRVAELGFMVITGAGGGIMQAGNQGAGASKSFGLNISLPFEQGANPFIAGDHKLIVFKYFFTRKLFFLRESDAIALFPGGFGTLDESFECITLSQTGRFGPLPVVLMDVPGGNYWHDLNNFIHKQLIRRGLISPDDTSLYTIADNVDVACAAITSFYRVYHSSRYVKDLYVIRLKTELSDAAIKYLNENFSDILVKGKIEKSRALPQEIGDETFNLPRLVLHFNQRDFGRLYQMISTINQLGAGAQESEHPEQK
ncbi:MAG: TIGR00730 family Rossman fold protein [Oscillatoriaceae bacterium SKW80]|nr:TIGR00730 family Rossman fold protein [Oscillatoriaceae bacterium SKYG93]MCX8121950.1 TIGR00730 family Rossman fold protein [Oscillatoriaceae bacterium SKW80]MDW8454236.1 TIGR00730 family Rossman fold protein [Oscillatoriaceae cyanobacterium SKYGB_i_bin93]HIK29101.1 TIGR00730 family Rossman fold protein [Oscillatoriaceae cyanobacterium M7585_C2015_266]